VLSEQRVSMTRIHYWRGVLGCLLALSVCAVACDKPGEEGTVPTTPEKLAPLSLRDDSPDLLFTWIDEAGGTHTGVSISEIPKENRELVRIVTKDAGHGGTFYVADLRAKAADGSYPVRSMPRREWEKKLAGIRQAKRAKQAPADTPEAGGAGLTATIYGADWCKPCHQAKAYLEKRGVAVTERDIDKHPRYGAEMKRKLRKAGRGSGSIPVIDLSGIILQGYNPRAIDRAIARAVDRARRQPRDVQL
jgi:glutaredoxin